MTRPLSCPSTVVLLHPTFNMISSRAPVRYGRPRLLWLTIKPERDRLVDYASQYNLTLFFSNFQRHIFVVWRNYSSAMAIGTRLPDTGYIFAGEHVRHTLYCFQVFPWSALLSQWSRSGAFLSWFRHRRITRGVEHSVAQVLGDYVVAKSDNYIPISYDGVVKVHLSLRLWRAAFEFWHICPRREQWISNSLTFYGHHILACLVFMRYLVAVWMQKPWWRLRSSLLEFSGK